MSYQLIPTLRVINEQVKTNSLDLANHFQKLHKNVIQSIQSLDLPEEFTRLNFQPSEYFDSTGRRF